MSIAQNIEFFKRLRKMNGMADATLIALTGWGSEQDRLRSQQAGFDLHLTKPVDMQALTSLLRDHVPTVACPE